MQDTGSPEAAEQAKQNWKMVLDGLKRLLEG
jgi:hypothetical protein